MNGLLWLTPLITTVAGWFGSRLLLRILFLPAAQKRFAEKLGTFISENIFSFSDMEEKLIDSGNLSKIMPQVEEHIDHFLQVRLKESMPVIGMFVGDRTMNQLKAVFMEELDVLFPVIMKNYISQLKNELDVQKVVRAKIYGNSGAVLASAFRRLYGRELLYVEISGGVLGFCIGVIQFFIILFFLK